jgi:OFA family oxalate/formate antiporter-like MFS transporter
LTILPLSDYLGRKRTILFSNSFITASLLGILLFGNSWGMLSLFVGIMALFYGATFPIYGACAGDFFPKEMMGTVIGAWTPFYGVGVMLVHWVNGMIRDTTGSYEVAFLINPAMAGVGILLMGLVRQKSPAST